MNNTPQDPAGKDADDAATDQRSSPPGRRRETARTHRAVHIKDHQDHSFREHYERHIPRGHGGSEGWVTKGAEHAENDQPKPSAEGHPHAGVHISDHPEHAESFAEMFEPHPNPKIGGWVSKGAAPCKDDHPKP